MNFKEFTSPEEANYDITSSLKNEDNIQDDPSEKEEIYDELLELTGYLEDEETNTIEEDYGITIDEYYHPTRETVDKVKAHLNVRSR